MILNRCLGMYEDLGCDMNSMGNDRVEMLYVTE